MLNSLFLSVINMSLVASIIIIFVLFARILLKKMPKIFSYVLWSVVFIRLLVPISFESDFSILPSKFQQEKIISNWTESYVGPVKIFHDNREEYEKAVSNGVNPISAGEDGFYVVTGEDEISTPKTVKNTIIPKLSYIWLAGIFILMIYSVVEFTKLKRNLIVAMPLKDNIYIADYITTPFVIGFFKPKIYLPSSLSEREQEYIIKHEKCHIKRFDHITRIVAFIALAVHWFNPLVWVAFCLSGKDMEMSCDESVMKTMDRDIRKEYANSLLRFASMNKKIHAVPLAFGENDTKSRIKNVLNYKKPLMWVSMAGFLIVLVSVVGFIGNSKIDEPPMMYAYFENGVVPMNLGTYSWDGCVVDSISYTEMDYDNSIYYSGGIGERNANIFLSMSNTPENFNSDNIKGKNKFKIVEMKRYSNGEEEILNEFDDNIIAVNLAPDSTYLYEFKVEFSGNYAYYSVRIDNNSAYKEKTDKLTAEQAVETALNLEKVDESYSKGEHFSSSYIILGTDKEENAEKIYTLTMVGHYSFQNGNFVKISGSGVIPVVVTLNNDNTVEFEYPKDGNRYEESVKNMFPKKYQKRVLRENTSDLNILKNQEEADAKEYLKQIERDAKVGSYADFEYKTLSDLNVSNEVINKLEDFYKSHNEYTHFIGTQEYLENNKRVVAQMSYDENKNEITFTKYMYDTKEILEEFKFDSLTGNII